MVIFGDWKDTISEVNDNRRQIFDDLEQSASEAQETHELTHAKLVFKIALWFILRDRHVQPDFDEYTPRIVWNKFSACGKMMRRLKCRFPTNFSPKVIFSSEKIVKILMRFSERPFKSLWNIDDFVRDDPYSKSKVGCVFPMIAVSILHHA